MQLSRARIVATAIELIERDGVEAVGLPRLATELGCGVMSLYNHIPSKSALLDGVADEVMSGIEVTAMPGASWEEQVLAHARAFRKLASARPRCMLIAVSRPATTVSTLRPVERALATLAEAGFRGQDAVRIVRAFVAYTIGSLLPEVCLTPGLSGDQDQAGVRPRLRAAEFPQIAGLTAELQQKDPDADFEFGLNLLLHAAAALHQARTGPGRGPCRVRLNPSSPPVTLTTSMPRTESSCLP